MYNWSSQFQIAWLRWELYFRTAAVYWLMWLWTTWQISTIATRSGRLSFRYWSLIKRIIHCGGHTLRWTSIVAFGTVCLISSATYPEHTSLRSLGYATWLWTTDPCVERECARFWYRDLPRPTSLGSPHTGWPRKYTRFYPIRTCR